MKVQIEEMYGGYVVTYYHKEDVKHYVFKSIEDLTMLEDVAKKFLSRKIKAVDQLAISR